MTAPTVNYLVDLTIRRRQIAALREHYGTRLDTLDGSVAIDGRDVAECLEIIAAQGCNLDPVADLVEVIEMDLDRAAESPAA